MSLQKRSPLALAETATPGDPVGPRVGRFTVDSPHRAPRCPLTPCCKRPLPSQTTGPTRTSTATRLRSRALPRVSAPTGRRQGRSGATASSLQGSAASRPAGSRLPVCGASGAPSRWLPPPPLCGLGGPVPPTAPLAPRSPCWRVCCPR